MARFFEYIILAAITLAFAVALGILLSFPCMWLWNGLLPDLFGFKTITWLQAWGLMVLSGMMFKSPSSSSKKSE